MKCEFRICHIFRLVNALAGFVSVSGAGIIPKYICPGDSVLAFQNIRFNNCSSVVSLYINGEINTLIARWSFENCSRNETLLPDYNDRVFLNGNGTVSIHNVHPWDEAKYTVDCQMGSISREDVVQIIVMAAPTNDCIPKISQQGSSLFASLKAHSCGKPVATLYWKGYGDVPNTTGPVLKLNPGNQDGTYYACIDGPALTCVRNARDYCSTITIGGYTSPPILMETLDVKMVIGIVVGIVLGTSLILVIAVILIRMFCRKTTPISLKESVEHRQANGNARGTFGENEGRTDGRKVKDENSVPGSSRASIRYDDQYDDFSDTHFMSLLQKDLHRPTDYDMLRVQQTFPFEKYYGLWKKHFSNLRQRVNMRKTNERWIKDFDPEKSQQMQPLIINTSRTVVTIREKQTRE